MTTEQKRINHETSSVKKQLKMKVFKFQIKQKIKFELKELDESKGIEAKFHLKKAIEIKSN